MTECCSDAFPREEQGPIMYLADLRLRHRRELALLLNPRTTLNIDWTTLADLLEFSAREIQEIDRRGEHDSPTLLLLQDLESRQPHYTVNDLVRVLTEMDRPDAVEVLQKAQDEYFQSYPPPHPSEAPPPAYSTLPQSSHDQAVTRGGGGFSPLPYTTEVHTSQDAAPTQPFVEASEIAASDFNLPPTLEPSSPAGAALETRQEYDVYLSYSGEDCEFAEGVKKRLRQAGKSVYDFEMSAPLGSSVPVERGDMIMEHSRKMVIILSRAYVDNKWCKFEASLAKVKSPDCHKRNLIPIMLGECTLPSFLRDTYYLDYQRYAKLQDEDRLNDHFWHRLVKAV